MNKYVPKQQDLIYIDFDPQSGGEIIKRCPAIVLSNDAYNQRTGLAVVSPITHTHKNNITYIPVNGKQIDGYVNALQFHTFDFSLRHAELVEVASDQLFFQVMKVIMQIF